MNLTVRKRSAIPAGLAGLSVEVPRTLEHMWATLKKLDDAGPWSSADAIHASGVRAPVMNGYVAGLERIRIVKIAGVREDPNGRLKPAATYKLARRPREAPRPPGEAHQQIWTALRALKHASADEIALAASTAEYPVSATTTLRYLTWLHDGGYLACAGDGAARTWRLKPARNTGPYTPQLVSTQFLWDPNESKPGWPTPAEEVRP